jgi:NTE family protein
VVMVHLTPAERSGDSQRLARNHESMHEISFNSGLIREMRAVTFVNKRIDEGKTVGGKLMLVHVMHLGKQSTVDLEAKYF